MQNRQRLIQDQKNKKDNDQIKKNKSKVRKKGIFWNFQLFSMHRIELTKYST